MFVTDLCEEILDSENTNREIIKEKVYAITNGEKAQNSNNDEISKQPTSIEHFTKSTPSLSNEKTKSSSKTVYKSGSGASVHTTTSQICTV